MQYIAGIRLVVHCIASTQLAGCCMVDAPQAAVRQSSPSPQEAEMVSQAVEVGFVEARSKSVVKRYALVEEGDVGS